MPCIYARKLAGKSWKQNAYWLKHIPVWRLLWIQNDFWKFQPKLNTDQTTFHRKSLTWTHECSWRFSLRESATMKFQTLSFLFRSQVLIPEFQVQCEKLLGISQLIFVHNSYFKPNLTQRHKMPSHISLQINQIFLKPFELHICGVHVSVL